MHCGKLSPCVLNIYLLKSNETYNVLQNCDKKLYLAIFPTRISQRALMRNAANYHHWRYGLKCFYLYTNWRIFPWFWQNSFDKEPHQSIHHKNEHYGIKSSTLQWIWSYFSNRMQSVIVEGVSSNVLPVSTAVAQYTLLGPLLFLSFTNDMLESITSFVKFLCDDGLDYRAIHSTNDTF